MIVLAILATMAAVVCTVLVVGANGMRSSPGEFEGRIWIISAWGFAAAMWLAWWVG